MKRNTFFGLLSLLFSVVLSLAAAELVVRLLGYKPWKSFAGSAAGIVEPDSVLGWRNRPGAYRFAPLKAGEPEVNKVFWSDYSRATGSREAHDAGVDLLLFGGSFMQGFGLSDEETLGWKLQQRFPRTRVRNFGTQGYGSYQSLLAMEREFRTREQRPGMVLYGLIHQHTKRNVASPDWQRAMAERQKDANTLLPYCDLSAQGELVEHRPEGYLMLPLRSQLVLVRLIEEMHFSLRARNRVSNQEEITRQILRRMYGLAVQNGLSMYVVLFGAAGDELLERCAAFLRHEGLEVISCLHPEMDNPEMRIPNEGHPNGRMNTFWTECISDAVREDVETLLHQAESDRNGPN